MEELPIGLIATVLDIANRFAKDVKKSLGVIEDEIVVKVSGGPRINKQQMYYLAAAIGWGLLRRLTPPPDVFIDSPAAFLLVNPFYIGIEYDAAGNEVIFILRCKQAIAAALGYRPATAISNLSSQAVINGPPDPVTGGTWGSFLTAGIGVVPVIPTPNLP